MSQETDYLAKVCANIIKAQGLSQSDNITVGAQLLVLLTGFKEIKSGDETLSHLPDFSPPVSKAVVDDRPRRLVARSGTACFCSQCAKQVFEIITDVTDPMSYTEFIAAYKPVGHIHFMGPNTEIADLAIDCPLCKAEKSVPLTVSEV